MGFITLVRVFGAVDKPKGRVLNWYMLFVSPEAEKTVVPLCYWDMAVLLT